MSALYEEKKKSQKRHVRHGYTHTKRERPVMALCVFIILFEAKNETLVVSFVPPGEL